MKPETYLPGQGKMQQGSTVESAIRTDQERFEADALACRTFADKINAYHAKYRKTHMAVLGVAA